MKSRLDPKQHKLQEVPGGPLNPCVHTMPDCRQNKVGTLDGDNIGSKLGIDDGPADSDGVKLGCDDGCDDSDGETLG